MDPSSYYCHNNSMIVPINLRQSYKKLRTKSIEKFPKPLAVLSPTRPLTRADTKVLLPSRKPIPQMPTYKRPKDSVFDLGITQLDISNLKSLLTRIIKEEQSALRLLHDRCQLVLKMFKTVEKSNYFSEKDAQDLLQLLEQMGKTILKTSETELELGSKNRLYEKLNLEVATFKKNYASLQTRLHQADHELRELREKIKELQEDNTKQLKVNENEKHRYAESNNKVQVLEESLRVLANAPNISTQDAIVKLKSTINALLKDAYDYKKEIQNL